MKAATRAAAIVCAVFLALGAVACAKKADDTPAVMTLGEHTVDEGLYRFLYATYKARYIEKYSQDDTFSDSADFWSREHSEGETNAGFFDSLVRDSVRMYLVAERLFDELKLTISDGDAEYLESYEDDLITERYDSDRGKFEVALAEFGATSATFRALVENGIKMDMLFDYYLGAKGVRPLTDADRAEHYRENYVRFAQINVNDRFAYVEEDGAYVWDENGNLKTRDLTAEEYAEKARLIGQIDDALAAGDTVESLYSEYSENRDYPGGYYFKADGGGKYDQRIIDTASALGVGETSKIETQYGTFWIERLSLPEKGWDLAGNADFFENFDDEVKNAVFDGILRSHFNEIVEDAGKVDAIDVTKVKANYELY